jgi:hypothetical protein
MDRKHIGCQDVNWDNLAQYKIQGIALVNTVMNLQDVRF